MGDDFPAAAQMNFLGRPVDVAGDAVGDIDNALFGQLHHAGTAEIEAAVMRGDDRIVLEHTLQFLRVVHATGNDRIWIDRSRFLGEVLGGIGGRIRRQGQIVAHVHVGPVGGRMGRK